MKNPTDVVALGDSLNPNWEDSEKGAKISVTRNIYVQKSTKIFCMGSCFAVEVRKALASKGLDVFPKYNEIEFDPRTQTLAKLPDRDNINHYNTFAIVREFENAFNSENREPQEFWKVKRQSRQNETKTYYQAPDRKQIYASSVEALVDLNGKIDECISQGIHTSDLYIITLGLTETWFNKKTGNAVGTPPLDAPNSVLADFKPTSFDENYRNMRRVCELIRDNYPDRRILLTVSPVALGQTYSENDVVVANSESKAILRAVAGQLTREFDHVVYWPSFEIAGAHDVFHEDGRHVSEAGVSTIVDAFLKVHSDI